MTCFWWRFCIFIRLYLFFSNVTLWLVRMNTYRARRMINCNSNYESNRTLSEHVYFNGYAFDLSLSCHFGSFKLTKYPRLYVVVTCICLSFAVCCVCCLVLIPYNAVRIFSPTFLIENTSNTSTGNMTRHAAKWILFKCDKLCLIK